MGRKIGRTAGLFVVVAGLVGLGGGPVTALTGSCKERASSTAPWRSNGRGFEACKALNQQRDGDNVFDERGRVWWNVRG